MTPRDRFPYTAVFLVLLIVAVALRAQVIVAIPNFFGPGDPGIYFQMARGTLHHGWPRMEFIYHYLTHPATIVHAEDYYEAAFGYLLAPALLFGGEKPAAAAVVSLVFGVGAVLLVWWLARRHGPAVALIAAALVAFEPWSIYYSGLIMKETVVSVAVLVFLELLRRAAAADRPPFRPGLLLGVATVAAGVFQYELIPIVGLTGILVLAIHRRAALPGYLLGAGACLATLFASTWLSAGVPISAKYAFALGASLVDPDRLAPARDIPQTLRSILPFRYLGAAILTAWYPLLILLAALGAAVVPRIERTIWVVFAAVFLYLHAIPSDLWCRDFIPLTAVLAGPVALGLCRSDAWRSRRWLAALVWAAAFFLCVVPGMIRWTWHHAAGFNRWVPFSPLWLGVILALLMFVLVLCGPTQSIRAWTPKTAPIVAALAVSANFWLLLPYPAIYRNAQFPDYEIARAHRERVGHWLRDSVPRGAMIAERPEEISLYSGFPVVALPEFVRPGSLERLVARYGVRYLLVDPGVLPDSVMRVLPARVIGQREETRLLEFRIGEE